MACLYIPTISYESRCKEDLCLPGPVWSSGSQKVSQCLLCHANMKTIESWTVEAVWMFALPWIHAQPQSDTKQSLILPVPMERRWKLAAGESQRSRRRTGNKNGTWQEITKIGSSLCLWFSIFVHHLPERNTLETRYSKQHLKRCLKM